MIPDTASMWAAARRFEVILRRDAKAYSFAPLSDIYRQLGLVEDALDTARKGCLIHPAFAAGQMSLAKAALESAFKDEATRALESVVRITPENIEAQRLLAAIYTDAGNESAALRCLEVAASLDVSSQEDTTLVAEASAEELPEEELLDADILELSDDLIEEDGVDFSDPFAASPDRPSLGDDFNRAEPFLMETPPPIYKDEPADVEPTATMASATIAELYVSQGFADKGAEVYRELLASDPLNELYKKRFKELTEPQAEPVIRMQGNVAEGVLQKLTEWLGNIGRVRECRTKNL